MILIGLTLTLNAAIRTYRNGGYLPFFFISIAGFVILVVIYWFWGKDW